jgi:hypothetical protein
LQDVGRERIPFKVPDRRSVANLGLALGLLALPGCTSGRATASTTPSSAAAPFPALKPFFIPGETITWEVTVAGITGARARLAVGEPATIDGGGRIVILRAEAESAGIAILVKEVRSKMSSWIDTDSGVPSRSESDSSGLTSTLLVEAERHPDGDGQPSVALTIHRKKRSGDETQSKTQRLPVIETHDPLSATLALRAWNAKRGSRALLYSLGGARLWRTELTFEGNEKLKTALGHRNTVRITGVSTRLRPTFDVDAKYKPRTFTIWVTDDDQRIPVQIRARTEMGDMIARVTSYESPDT